MQNNSFSWIYGENNTEKRIAEEMAPKRQNRLYKQLGAILFICLPKTVQKWPMAKHVMV